MKKQDALTYSDGTNSSLHYAIGDSLKDDYQDLVDSFKELGLSEDEAALLAGTDPGSYQVLKAVKPNLTSFNPKQRVLLPFSSFVDSAGQAYFNTVSSLHTSRVSAYGFTAEAYALGLQEYQITEQLDGRICDVCRLMHGKSFSVSEARSLLDVVLRVSSKEDFKSLQPWPSQSKKALQEMSQMSSAEIVAKGWHIPPFHPRCRGLLARKGKVPSLAQIESGNIQDTHDTATPEDFGALGYEVSPDKVKAWNKAVKLPPAEVVSTLLGKTTDEYLASVAMSTDVMAASAIKALSISNGVVKLKVSGPMQPGGTDATVALKFDPNSSSVSIQSLAVDDQAKTSAFLKKFMQTMYTLASDATLPKLAVDQASGYGAYLFAKAGFAPSTVAEWEALKKGSFKALKNAGLYPSQDPLLDKALGAIKTSQDPAMIFALADLSVGEVALAGQAWPATLLMDDPESVARFLTYFGD